MNYKKKRLTDKQFQIKNRQIYDSKVTDNFLKNNGVNPITLTKIPVEVIRARIASYELLNQYKTFLSNDQIKAINKFNSKVNNKKKCHLLTPNLAYPILNLATKIKRKAHQQTVQARQIIKELRYNQP